MSLWEHEIKKIQKDIFLSTHHVILIESHDGLREMLSYAIGFLGERYHVLHMTFEQAEQWLQERETQQIIPSVFLFDCAHESVKVQHFLDQLHVIRTTFTHSPKVLGMTHRPNDLLADHSCIDRIFLKPFSFSELRKYIL